MIRSLAAAAAALLLSGCAAAPQGSKRIAMFAVGKIGGPEMCLVYGNAADAQVLDDADGSVLTASADVRHLIEQGGIVVATVRDTQNRNPVLLEKGTTCSTIAFAAAPTETFQVAHRSLEAIFPAQK